MSNGHPHNNGEEHHRRPEWWNGISLGNIITLGGMMVMAALAWGQNEQKQVQQDKDVAAVDKRVDKLEASIEGVRKDLSTVAVQQAVLNANIAALLRAQGIKPMEAQ